MKNKIFNILLVTALVITGTIGATGMSVSAVDDDSSSLGHDLVLQLNESSDPIKFWNSLTTEEQQAIEKSLVSEIQYKVEIIETYTQNVLTKDTKASVVYTECKKILTNDIVTKEIIVYVTGFYYGDEVWHHVHLVDWTYDGTTISDFYRASDGDGGVSGLLTWTYKGEEDSAGENEGTSLYCMSKGCWEVTLLGVTINTFYNTIETTHYPNGDCE
jgi:hypothetical protein